MAKRKKYVYAIVHKKTNKLLIEDEKLPIYWNRTVAIERVALFPKYELTTVNEDYLLNFIITHPF